MKYPGAKHIIPFRYNKKAINTSLLVYKIWSTIEVSYKHEIEHKHNYVCTVS